MMGEWKRGGGRRRERGSSRRRRMDGGDEEEMMVKKGPWKAEEDEVLVCHVSKHGPRDWSSIRSKGLLHRTGKSCRLRWVNKLRPNLKNGMKFSAEEERVVIELQGQFGNRWARIATHLPGRTDNDVKNFWSSRQKRLARLLQNPSSSTSSQIPKSQNRNRNRNEQVPLFSHDDGPQSKVPKLSFSPDEESSSSSFINNSNLVQILPLSNQVLNPMPISCEQSLFQFEKKPTHDLELQRFPPVPDFLPDYSKLEPKSEFDPNFFDVFGNVETSGYGGDDDMAQFPFMPSCRIKKESPDVIFDELPLDMFD